MKRIVCLALLLSGCFRLDSFLYARKHEESYTFKAESDRAEDAIAPERYEELRVVVNDQITLGGVYVRAETQPPIAHLWYFNGQGGTVDNSFDKIKRISNLGFDVFAIDYRGFGVSTNVAPTEAGIAEDTAAALAFLKARIGDATPIGYYGLSLGTATATQRAVLSPPFALLLESPLASLENLKSDAAQMDFPIGFIANDTWNTEKRIESVRVPLMIIAGELDDYVRIQNGERIFARANEPKTFVRVANGHHSDISIVAYDLWAESVRSHFSKPL